MTDRAGELLIVDDDLGQVVLIKELLSVLGLSHHLHHVQDGLLALQFLRAEAPYQNAPRPHLILLDLNLPGKHGCEVLQEIKSDPALRSIPVIIMSTSRSSEDIQACYHSHANAFISKAADLDAAIQVVSAIDRFWLQTVELPHGN